MSTNNQTGENKPGLFNEQKQKIKKYAVFALMGVICTGYMWLIFAPSAEDKARQEQTVSALPQEMSGKDVIEALAQPRNTGFFTATAEFSKDSRFSIDMIPAGEDMRLHKIIPRKV